MKTATVTMAEMQRRIARFKELEPNTMAFVDTRLPGHEREIFNMIGSGVNEDPLTRPAIADVAGFTVTHNGCAPGCGAALHNHATVEVFIPLTGRWAVYWSDDGEDEVILEAGDVISVPVGVMRGFRNAGDDYAVLIAVIEGNDPGKIDWHPSVLSAARETGLDLDDEGRLVERTD